MPTATPTRPRAHAYIGLRGSAYPDRLRPDGPPRRPHASATPRPDFTPRPDVALRPAATPNADWQPGVVPGSAGRRPTLDGEPVPGAVAASATGGWVDVARGSDRGDLRYEPDLIGERMGAYVTRHHGTVALIRCRADD